MAASGVKVSVEPVLEHQIQEVALDGQETYVTPLSMSENLTKLAHKIDFGKSDEDEVSGEKEKDEELTPFQPPQWPWESVRNKLRNAFTEVCVLADVLSIAKETRYMVLDEVSQEEAISKPALQLLAKKRSLSGAAQILVEGAGRLFKSQVVSGSLKSNKHDFHVELLKLHQNWRLKRVGKNIIGDLSFKTAGSRFWHTGAFEVSKAIENGATPGQKYPLEITVPSDLEGKSYIHVCVQPEGTDLAQAGLFHCLRGRVPSESLWQEKLEAAQTVLFCKELFAQLAREAVQLKAPIPHLVVGNQIVSHVFPGIQLRITLCHETNIEKK
ncbi:mediator of RNA polymerase II transcription subunit 17-like, partial [Saccoglossus kowalevskii]